MCFCKWNIFKCFRENRREKQSLAAKDEAEKAGSANNDTNETLRPPISQSRAFLSYFYQRTGWLKHVLVLKKYDNFDRLKHVFNIEKP